MGLFGAGPQTSQTLQTNNGDTQAATNNLNSVNTALQQQAQGGGAVNQATQAALTNATNQGIQQAAGVVGSTKGINPALAGRLAGQQAAGATQQAANQAGALTAGNTMAATNQLSQNALSQYGTAEGGLSAANSANAGMATANLQGQQGLIGGALSGVGAAIGLAHGGKIPNYDSGGSVTPLAAAPMPASPKAGPQSKVGQFLQGASSGMGSGSANPLTAGLSSLGSGIGNLFRPSAPAAPNSTPSELSSGAAMAQSMGADPMTVAGMQGPMLSKGGKVPVMVSPGEKYIPPSSVEKVAKGKESPIKAGKTIPGKEIVKGDSEKNDIVPMKAQAGGMVIPKSVMQSKNKEAAIMNFVKAELSKNKLKRS